MKTHYFCHYSYLYIFSLLINLSVIQKVFQFTLWTEINLFVQYSYAKLKSLYANEINSLLEVFFYYHNRFKPRLYLGGSNISWR